MKKNDVGLSVVKHRLILFRLTLFFFSTILLFFSVLLPFVSEVSPSAMAIFSQMVTIKSQYFLQPYFRIVASRSRSSIPGNFHMVEIDLGEGSETEIDGAGTVKRLEDAIHGIVVRSAAPVWLPFRPGSSYWVPPQKKGFSRGLAELVGRLANPMKYEELMSLATSRGWPSSSYFIRDSKSGESQEADAEISDDVESH